MLARETLGDNYYYVKTHRVQIEGFQFKELVAFVE